MQAVDDHIGKLEKYEVDNPLVFYLLEHIDSLSSREKHRADLDCSESNNSQSGTHESDDDCENFFTTNMTEMMEKVTSERLENCDGNKDKEILLQMLI